MHSNGAEERRTPRANHQNARPPLPNRIPASVGIPPPAPPGVLDAVTPIEVHAGNDNGEGEGAPVPSASHPPHRLYRRRDPVCVGAASPPTSVVPPNLVYGSWFRVEGSGFRV